MKTTAFIITLLLAGTIAAQDRSPAEYIRSLHEGTLIVKLPTRTTKINAMQKILDEPGIDKKQRARLEKLIAINREEAATFNRNMVLAFDSTFSFSKVRFTYDYHYDKLKNGQFDGIFLDKKLQEDASINPGNKPYFVLRFGNSKPTGSSGIEAMVLMNDRMEDLKDPFPHYQRLNDLAVFIGSILPAPEQDKRDAIRLVEKLDKKLYRFYQRVGPGD